MFKSFARAVGVVAVSAVFLAGCGGGGGGGGGGSSGSSAPTNVQGFAATGAAISGGTVSLKCVSGAVLTTTTAADGSFTLSPSSAQLPCVLRVVSGPTTLYSFVDAFGRLNATPLSDLVLAHAGADTPANIYAGFNTTLATTIRAGLAAAKTYLTAQISKLDLNPVTIDPLTGTFVVGDAHDVILDQLKAALTANTKTLDDLRTAARTRVDVTTQLPAGEVVISETSQSVNNSTLSLLGSKTFTLPSVVIEPGAFLVVRGQPLDALSNSAQVVYISGATANEVPFWNANGSIELLKGGVTRSFVRFGTNTDQPVSYVATTTAPALPYTASTYGNSIVRSGNTAALMDKTNTATWSSVAFC